MAQLGINPRRQGLFEALDFFGNFSEAFDVAIWIGAALLIANDGEAFAENSGEVS